MRRRTDERGSALVVVIMALSVVLLLGLALLQQVTGEGTAALDQRHREAAFNLAETTLNVEVFVLGNAWPSTAARAYPSQCAPSATVLYGCPDSSAVAQAVSQADPSGAANWAVTVRDNGSSSVAWSESFLTGQPSWDANGDGRVWVRSNAVARSRPVTVVALVTQSPTSAGFPQSVIVAGRFATDSQGNKVYVDTQGGAAQPSPLFVRCTTGAPSSCLDYPPSKGQVSPDTVQTGYVGGPATTPRVIADFIEQAQLAGTYYDTCPSSLTGAVVVIRTGECSYTSNSVWNSAASPGMVVLLNGSLSLSGTVRYYGVIYAPNQGGRSDVLVTLTGNSTAEGSVLVDGNAGVAVGGSGKVVYNPSAINSARFFLAPQVVKNTWRQL